MFPQSSFFSGGAGPTYSYSSSSFMSNVNGVTYKESKTARAGPEGVSKGWNGGLTDVPYWIPSCIYFQLVN